MLIATVIPSVKFEKNEYRQALLIKESQPFAVQTTQPVNLGVEKNTAHNRIDDSETKKVVKKISRAKARRAKMMPFEKNVFTAAEYNVMLKGTGLSGCGKYFKKMEDKYKVNALFAIGVAMHESALGFKPIRNHNYFGMIGMSFKSKSDNIMYFGELMSGRLYKDSGKNTIGEIGSRYAADPNWSSRVTSHMIERISIAR